VKSWKTTAWACAAAFFAFVLFSPEYFARVPWLVSLAKFACAGGLVGLGLSAKDADVHSTKEQVAEATRETKAQ
jgi:hypothetical protein